MFKATFYDYACPAVWCLATAHLVDGVYGSAAFSNAHTVAIVRLLNRTSGPTVPKFPASPLSSFAESYISLQEDEYKRLSPEMYGCLTPYLKTIPRTILYRDRLAFEVCHDNAVYACYSFLAAMGWQALLENNVISLESVSYHEASKLHLITGDAAAQPEQQQLDIDSDEPINDSGNATEQEIEMATDTNSLFHRSQ